MKSLFCLALFSSALFAQDLSVVIHDGSGDTLLPSTYGFAGTMVGTATSLTIRASNDSGLAMQLASLSVISSDGTTTTPDFNVTGVQLNKVFPANSANFEEVTVNFIPQSNGPKDALLQATYLLQQNGCVLSSTNPATECTAQTVTLATLQGNATPSQLTLTYTPPNGQPTVLFPSGSSPLSFGNVSTSATDPYVFTLTNQAAVTVATPAVALQREVYGSSAFSLNTSGLPATLGPSGSGSFTITFAPGQVGLTTAILQVGQYSYPLAGAGLIVADIDALQISYVDAQGVRTLPQAATPINFGQLTAGTASSATFTFTVANPVTSFNAVAVPNLTVTGAGFALAGAPAAPVNIPPGQSITFQIVFSGSSNTTYTGALAIGARQFSLTGQGVTSPLPDATFQLDVQPLTSQKQVHLTIQLAAASPISAIGQLAMAFEPSVANVTGDPAVVFTSVNSRQLQVNVAAGAQVATYNGQSNLTFQTGATAGTLTFTLTFPDKAAQTQAFTIAPETIQISSGTAVRQSPNLVVTLTGFDNTYSASKLNFTFYDTAGNILTPTPLSVDASSSFHQYFFNNNHAGGAFALQAVFPVTGDITQIGSVTASLQNTSGSSTATESFQ